MDSPSSSFRYHCPPAPFQRNSPFYMSAPYCRSHSDDFQPDLSPTTVTPAPPLSVSAAPQNYDTYTRNSYVSNSSGDTDSVQRFRDRARTQSFVVRPVDAPPPPAPRGGKFSLQHQLEKFVRKVSRRSVDKKNGWGSIAEELFEESGSGGLPCCERIIGAEDRRRASVSQMTSLRPPTDETYCKCALIDDVI